LHDVIRGFPLAVLYRQEADMLHFLKKLLMFRLGQKTTRGVARSIGFGKIATIVGLIGGYKYMRRHA
jgi:hypothetical protein